VDILTLKLANRYTDSRLRMTVTIADKHIFSSEAARDAYFASNPGELEEGLYVQAGTQFFRYHDEEWVEVTAIVKGPKGEKGDPGEKGEKGDQGEKGEKGDKGDLPAHEWEDTALRFENPDGSWGQFVDLKGEKGDQGEKGEKGDPGEKGEKGDKGDPGEKGEKGDKGDPGEKGEKGDPGEKGEKGDPGEKGEKGDKGDPGEKGEKGDPGEKGEKGDKGDPGEKGDKGDPGEKGEKGDPGEKGEKGDPPSHEWQGTALRFELPDGSWGPLVDLRGEKGDKGDTGPMPGHEWQGTAIRFQIPDGTWPSTWVDLKGDPGGVGEHGNENHTEEFSTVQELDAHTETRAALNKLGHVYHATLTATLNTGGWTGTEAPFAQIQEVSGILATDVPIVDVVLSGDWEVDEARLEAWGYIYRIVTSNNSITAYAREKPDVAISLQLKVVR